MYFFTCAQALAVHIPVTIPNVCRLLCVLHLTGLLWGLQRLSSVAGCRALPSVLPKKLHSQMRGTFHWVLLGGLAGHSNILVFLFGARDWAQTLCTLSTIPFCFKGLK